MKDETRDSYKLLTKGWNDYQCDRDYHHESGIYALCMMIYG